MKKMLFTMFIALIVVVGISFENKTIISAEELTGMIGAYVDKNFYIGKYDVEADGIDILDFVRLKNKIVKGDGDTNIKDIIKLKKYLLTGEEKYLETYVNNFELSFLGFDDDVVQEVREYFSKLKEEDYAFYYSELEESSVIIAENPNREALTRIIMEPIEEFQMSNLRRIVAEINIGSENYMVWVDNKSFHFKLSKSVEIVSGKTNPNEELDKKIIEAEMVETIDAIKGMAVVLKSKSETIIVMFDENSITSEKPNDKVDILNTFVNNEFALQYILLKRIIDIFCVD